MSFSFGEFYFVSRFSHLVLLILHMDFLPSVSFGHPQQMVLIQRDISMVEMQIHPMSITQHKNQVQVDQRSPHRARYTEPNRIESGQ